MGCASRKDKVTKLKSHKVANVVVLFLSSLLLSLRLIVKGRELTGFGVMLLSTGYQQNVAYTKRLDV